MPAYVDRAERLRLQIPITYRQQGDEDWFVSHVENMSESGVLFGPTGLRPGATVEVIVSPPVAIGGLVPGPHRCEGLVVRTNEVGSAAARLTSWKDLLES